jgi:sulfur-oxidizing protein SoxY
MSIKMRRRALLALPMVGAAHHAAAAIGGLPTKTAHDDSSPEWEQLRGRLFQQRAIATGTEAP